MNRIHSLSAIIALLVCLCSAPFAQAVVELERLSTDALQERYLGLIEELRCPKCQNQNLAGSDSMIAQDLRREVRIMLEEGKSDSEIKDFLVQRYGDFVLYRPPVSGTTLWVWLFPAVFFFGALLVAFFVIRNASKGADDEEVIDEDRLNSDEPVR